MSALRNFVITALRLAGITNIVKGAATPPATRTAPLVTYKIAWRLCRRPEGSADACGHAGVMTCTTRAHHGLVLGSRRRATARPTRHAHTPPPTLLATSSSGTTGTGSILG
jgi:hypothetical protein